MVSYNKKPLFPIKRKLLMIYVGILIIPIIFVSYYVSTSIRSEQIDTKIEEIEQDAIRTSNELLSTIGTIIRVSDWIYQDERLVDILEDDYESIYQIYLTYRNYTQFDDYMRHHPEIQHIRLYSSNPTLLNGNSINLLTDEIENMQWYQDTVAKNGQILWFYNEDPITKRDYLNLTRALYNDNQDLIGVMSIAIKNEDINQILANSMNTSLLLLNDQMIFSQPVLDKQSDIYLNYQYFTGITAENEDLSLDNNSNHGVSQAITFIEHDVQMPKTNFDHFKSVVTVPTAEIIQDANEVLFNAMLVIVLIFVATLIILYFFIRQFEWRIVQLQESMTNVANGNFDIPKKISGHDEITEVYQQLYSTMESLQALITEKYNYQLEQKNWEIDMQQAEFKLLASQINPHFLYNTLEMIRMKALLNQDLEVAEIVKILSKLMRHSLERSRDEVLISEDLKFIEMYLRIQKLRFGDRIQYRIVNQTSQAYTILPLLIQPLIENAFIHGFESVDRTVEIELKIIEQNNHIQINVRDNGAGIPQVKLQQIQEVLRKKEKSDRIGLTNIQQRLAIYYGPYYRLKIESIENEGTNVQFQIPKRIIEIEKKGEITHALNINR